MSRKFDDIIKQKIAESEVSPSNDLWNKIEAELDEKDDKKVIVIPFWQSGLFKQGVAAAVIFLLGGITATVLFDNNSTSQKQFVAEKNNNKNIQENTNEIEKTNNALATEKLANRSNSDLIVKENTNNTTQTNNSKIQKSSVYSNRKIQPTYKNKDSQNNFSNNKKQVVSNTQNLSASNYDWILDEETGAYQVVLKAANKLLNNSFLINNSVNSQQNNLLIAEGKIAAENSSEGKTSMMSLLENEKEEEKETVELNEEDDSYKQFKTKVVKLNYKGFWLGPHVGYESLFAGGEHYAGASFGADFGYDFGGSFGLQTGIKYALNAKTLKIYDAEDNLIDFKSEMNSVHVPLLFRYKFTKLTQKYDKPLSLNILAGAEYAFTDRKGLHQLGFVAGLEYDIFTQADLMLTIGTRAGLFNNLNKNQLDIPEKLTPLNYTLSAYIAVRFIDWAKKD